MCFGTTNCRFRMGAMEFVGRPPPAYGLKFLVKAGSPDPVMTRHLWAAGAAALSTAAGVAVLRTAASAAQPAATAMTTQRVVRGLRRICCPFWPGAGAFTRLSENVSGTVTTFLRPNQAPLRKIRAN